MGMRNTNDIIRDLGRCARLGETCVGCAYDAWHGPVPCTMRLLADAHQALTDMQDRCARYAEEIMALRQRWIPVTERLPEDRSNVLTVAYWNERWGVYMSWCAPERAEWYVHVGIGDRSNVAVTHWMPLPPAPEVE